MTEDHRDRTSRIAKNTLLLYFRMGVIMLVTLYTSRVVLSTLGITDFGIYGVVGGVVMMLAVLTSSMSSATVRFIAFYLGKKDTDKLNKVFTTSVLIHWILAVIVVILAEVICVWFLNNKMDIPPDRLVAANWVLQASLAVFVINLISVPYNAAIIAHEHMTIFAYVSILEAVLKLAVVYLLLLSGFDKLIYYAMLLIAVAVVLRVVYGVYCMRNFAECRAKIIIDKPTLKEMFGYSSWQMIGGSSAILRDQGGIVLLNLLFGLVANAAMTIAMQVRAAIMQLSSNILQAVNPQITKAYAEGEQAYFMLLMFRGVRFAFYLLLFVSLPILVETNYVLQLWLGTVAQYMVSFVRLILIFVLVDAITHPLSFGNAATGKVRNYQLIVGGFQMMSLPLAYVRVRFFDAPAEGVIWSFIVMSVCCLIARLLVLRVQIQLPVLAFFRKVIGNIMLVTMCVLPIPLLLHLYPEGSIRFVANVFLCLVSTAIAIYFIGCSKSERLFVRQKLSVMKAKFIRK